MSAISGENILTGSLSRDLVLIRKKLYNSADLVTRPIVIGGVRMNFVMLEGMVSLSKIGESVIRPLADAAGERATPESLFDFLENAAIVGDVKDVYDIDELIQLIASGFLAILIEGIPKSLVMGVQGFEFRSISEPSSDVNERGSRESFTEPIKVNLSMIRRRIKSGSVRFEMFELGSQSRTNACLVYDPGVVDEKLLGEVRRRMEKIPLKTVFDTGYLEPFLEGQISSLFSEVGMTERPDTVCAKIGEGRIAILLDGTPDALIVPFLFIENFQSFDDYTKRSYFALFIRLLKYLSFAVSIYLPALYVAISTFHPALLPHALLFNIAASSETTPFPMVLEALIIHFIYEIMREAGLRLPRPVGHAVSIVGALVIGDAAVTSGIIGAPMVMVVALTAISSFVVPKLYEPIAVLRFAFILIGGMSGLYGLSLASGILLVNLCRVNNLGVPYTAPISPFTPSAMRDTLYRASWKKMGRRSLRIQDLRGSSFSPEKKTGGKE